MNYTLGLNYDKDGVSDLAKWRATQPDMETAWLECPHADWLMLMARELEGVDGQAVLKIACDCAEYAVGLVPPQDTTAKVALQTARKWLVQKATRDEAIQARQALDMASLAHFRRTLSIGFPANTESQYAAMRRVSRCVHILDYAANRFHPDWASACAAETAAGFVRVHSYFPASASDLMHIVRNYWPTLASVTK